MSQVCIARSDTVLNANWLHIVEGVRFSRSLIGFNYFVCRTRISFNVLVTTMYMLMTMYVRTFVTPKCPLSLPLKAQPK